MDGVDSESLRFRCPSFADELVRREALERLQSSPEVVGDDEVGKMLFQLRVIVVVEALDGGVLDGSVHAFNLSVRPGMFELCEPVLDVVLVADPIEDVVESVFVADLIGELDTVAPTEGVSFGNRADGARSLSLQARTA